MRRLIRALIVALLLAIKSAAIFHHSPHSVPCSTLIVFGDGFTDDGTEAGGDDSHGFVRNSNGPVWPEYLNNMLGCQKYLNLAYSGARSGSGNFYFEGWSGIEWQIEQFILRRTTKSSKSSIIAVQSGGLIDFFAGETNITQIVGNLRNGLRKLIDSGAGYESTIVVMNLPDLSSAPGLYFAEEGPTVRENIAVSVAHINTQIRQLTLDLGKSMTRRQNVDIRFYDLNTAVFRAVTQLNVTEPFSYQKPTTTVKDINTYAYHDLWHPTTAVHYEVAKDVATFLEDS